ncbi:hypothetical protein SAMN04489765_2191 [Tsukamurella pulmonis]|uniref:Uncharacterized protein n=1 Tax=Tsukamurella pulmonis TaxID=47312 RepID=A0A1H1EHY1_9ACTN|nr:hypothetical protein [Tsukamurella pulmonis]SDQ87766.1 hypothetical protein SAMN04489765_2191 [Tsukamurella pulmonis]SUP20915.1 Uncharacterised protein [Tsukamurella pulmonis]
MGGMIAVHPFVPAAELTVGPDFATERVVRFIATWSLVAVPDSPGEYLTAEDIADGLLPRITADEQHLAISRPIDTEIDMAFDWMFTVGGSFIDYSGGEIITTDPRWLELETAPASDLRVFVVQDASDAWEAYRAHRTPPGVWDVRDGAITAAHRDGTGGPVITSR